MSILHDLGTNLHHEDRHFHQNPRNFMRNEPLDRDIKSEKLKAWTDKGETKRKVSKAALDLIYKPLVKISLRTK